MAAIVQNKQWLWHNFSDNKSAILLWWFKFLYKMERDEKNSFSVLEKKNWYEIKYWSCIFKIISEPHYFEGEFLDRLIGQVGRVFANGSGDQSSILGCVIPKTLKWYLMTPYLILSNIRYVSRVKWSNPGKGVAPSPTPRCSSYWKGSLLVAFDDSCQQ